MVRHFSQKLAIAVMVVGLLLGVPFLSLSASPPKVNAPVLVLVPPWVSPDTVIANAGGRSIGPRSAFIGSLAASDQPGFFEALKYHGAWAVLDGRPGALLCGV